VALASASSPSSASGKFVGAEHSPLRVRAQGENQKNSERRSTRLDFPRALFDQARSDARITMRDDARCA
jgi:hypothetical protein